MQAKEAAGVAINLALRVHDRLRVCGTCDNEDSSSTKQLVRNNNADVMERTSSRTETSHFRLDGIIPALGLGNGSKAGNEAVSVSVSCYDIAERGIHGKQRYILYPW